MQCFSDVMIWDIAAGSHYSLFIGDMAISKPDVYLCGRQPRYAYSTVGQHIFFKLTEFSKKKKNKNLK